MSKGAGQFSVSLVENQPFIDIRNARQESATLNSATRDDSNSPTTQLRRGVVVGETGNGDWVDALDGTVQANVAPNLASDEAPDTDWQSTTITAQIIDLGVTVAVILGAADDTIAEVVAALNGDSGFAAYFIAADDGGGLLEITSRSSCVTLFVNSSLATAFGAPGKSSTGACTRYGILLESVPSMLGLDDSAEIKNVALITANAIVRESDLLALTNDARVYFNKSNIQLD